MSKAEKGKKKSQQFDPSKPEDVPPENLPNRYADIEGVETTNIVTPKTEGASYKSSAVDGAEEYIFKGVNPGKAFLHPPKRLIEGRVIYRAKFYGHMNVPETRGLSHVKTAIDKLKTVAEVFRANNPGEDLKMVDLSISIRGLTCTEQDKKGAHNVIHQHPIHAISFSADDKRGKHGNMFAYIAKGRPPLKENICYVFEVKPKQAKELTATVGQAFELSYRKYLEAKKAREGFEQLKQVYRTASDIEKAKILEELESERQRRLKEVETERKRVEKMKIDPTYRPSHSYAAPVTVPENNNPLTVTNDDAELVTAVQKRASEMELEAKLAVQKKNKKGGDGDSNMASKWEDIQIAMEPFQVEPSLDPDTSYVVPTMQTSELDDAITSLNSQMEDLEEAFSYRIAEGIGPAEDVDLTPFTHPLLDAVDEKLKILEATADEMDMPDLPANYVMTEFMQAKEQARMPKKGTVKTTAGDWYATHKDMPEAPPNFVDPAEVKANTPRAGTVKNVAGDWYSLHKD